ncbi:hypothetical protein [Planctomicrobium sp. SH664]|uniref:hypothetical protein n=1 Tax=Planctomicrobium sp. SH664 TaxID=3448125 RepID=UPI003F5BCF90
MKSFAAWMTVLSLTVCTLGCAPKPAPAPEKPAETKTETTETKTETPPATTTPEAAGSKAK